MDGNRIRTYWSNEMNAMLKTYKQFENLIPASGKKGAAHNGEDGRYVEALLKEYLSKYLPNNLEVVTGFILRAAIKTGSNNKSRKKDLDLHSTQIDIIIYDRSNFPVYQRFGDSVIVPPEGVIAIISVKKHLRKGEIEKEIKSLKNAAKLCLQKNRDKKEVRGPMLALVTMHDEIGGSCESDADLVFGKLSNIFSNRGTNRYDEMPGFIGSLSQWSIIKSRRGENKSDYLFFKHLNDEEHLGFQFLITQILSVYYDETRNIIKKPGFTAFESGRNYDNKLGTIEFARLRGV